MKAVYTTQSEMPFDQLNRAILDQQVRDLRVEVRDGGLVLLERGDSDYAKKIDQFTSMAVTGLPLADNRIEVSCLYKDPSVQPNGEDNTLFDDEPPITILLTTGNQQLRGSCADNLQENGYFVVSAADGVECVAHLRRIRPDVLTLDTDLLWGEADGVFAQLSMSSYETTPVILLGSSPIASE